jgi:hypothetical protein
MQQRLYRGHGAALALAAIAMTGGIVSPVFAQGSPTAETSATQPASTRAAASKGRSRTVQSIINTINVAANTVQVTTKSSKETLDIALTPATEFAREERGVPIAELKAGDTVGFSSKELNGTATITTLNPLTLKVADAATVTVTKMDELDFNRITPLKATDLAANQTVAVSMTVGPDGKIEGKSFTVIVPKPRARRTTSTRRPRATEQSAAATGTATGARTSRRRTAKPDTQPAASTAPQQ